VHSINEAAVLNMVQYHHYSKCNENQEASNEVRFILFIYAIFFSAAN